MGSSEEEREAGGERRARPCGSQPGLLHPSWPPLQNPALFLPGAQECVRAPGSRCFSAARLGLRTAGGSAPAKRQGGLRAPALRGRAAAVPRPLSRPAPSQGLCRLPEKGESSRNGPSREATLPRRGNGPVAAKRTRLRLPHSSEASCPQKGLAGGLLGPWRL